VDRKSVRQHTQPQLATHRTLDKCKGCQPTFHRLPRTQRLRQATSPQLCGRMLSLVPSAMASSVDGIMAINRPWCTCPRGSNTSINRSTYFRVHAAFWRFLDKLTCIIVGCSTPHRFTFEQSANFRVDIRAGRSEKQGGCFGSSVHAVIRCDRHSGGEEIIFSSRKALCLGGTNDGSTAANDVS